MQVELIARTRAIAEAKPDQHERLKSQREELAAEQRRLTELAAGLLSDVNTTDSNSEQPADQDSTSDLDTIPLK